MGEIIRSNCFPLLADAGSISHAQIELTTSERYADLDPRRKTQETITADQVDEAELKALEDRLKRW